MAEVTYRIMCGERVCGNCRGDSFEAVNAEIAPLFLVGGGSFRQWVSSRAISRRRGYTSRSVKRASGLRATADDFSTAMRFHAACMTDNFWVCRDDALISYADVSFDQYDGFFGRLALGIDDSYQRYISEKVNPELTNIGNSDKAWYVDDSGTRWLYKRQPLRECLQEILASRTAEQLGIRTVRYELDYASEPDPELGRYGVVKSIDFTQGRGAGGRQVNLEHALGIVSNVDDYVQCAEVFAGFGCVHEYLDLLYLDILTDNPDRHEQNFGILRDRESGEVLSMAPNFDNNFAFMGSGEANKDGFYAAVKRFGWKQPQLSEVDLQAVTEDIRSSSVLAVYDLEPYLNRIRRNQEMVRERLRGE